MSQGETGATGETGAAGAEGAMGAAGATGAEGAVGRTGLQGEAGPASMLDPAAAKAIQGGLRVLVIATVVLYVLLLAGGIFVWVDSRANSSANAARISDIQQSRIDACKDTYDGIREVFRPFSPIDNQGDPLPTATPEQLANFKTFTETIDDLKAKCGKQIKGGS